MAQRAEDDVAAAQRLGDIEPEGTESLCWSLSAALRRDGAPHQLDAHCLLRQRPVGGLDVQILTVGVFGAAAAAGVRDKRLDGLEVVAPRGAVQHAAA